MAPLDIVVEAVDRAPRGKVLTGGILGDVNGDGRVDLTDAHLIAAYLNDPSDPSLPPGIGQASGDRGAAITRIYWVDSDKIQRANLGGSNIEDLVTGLSHPAGIALDAAGRRIYWTDRDTGKILSANLDGSNIRDLVNRIVEPTAGQDGHIGCAHIGAGPGAGSGWSRLPAPGGGELQQGDGDPALRRSPGLRGQLSW